MGWTFFHRDPSVSVRDTLANEYTNSQWRIIDSATVNRSEFYAAIEYVEDGYQPKGTVAALIFLVKFPTRDHHGHNFGYKDMDETMGPYYYNCPARILDKLTPTDNQQANEWRAACRAKQAKPKPKNGDTVQFSETIVFSNGYRTDTFRYVRGSRFIANGMTMHCRITGWKDRQYVVIRDGRACT